MHLKINKKNVHDGIKTHNVCALFLARSPEPKSLLLDGAASCGLSLRDASEQIKYLLSTLPTRSLHNIVYIYGHMYSYGKGNCCGGTL